MSVCIYVQLLQKAIPMSDPSYVPKIERYTNTLFVDSDSWIGKFLPFWKKFLEVRKEQRLLHAVLSPPCQDLCNQHI